MHKLTLKPTEENSLTIVGCGRSFGAAASELIRATSEAYGDEALTAELFKALGEVEEEREVVHFDFSCPEDGFTLTYGEAEPVSYFTFGQSHVHSFGGITFDKDVIVRITGENARDRMISAFGKAWSHQYFHEDLPKLLPYFPRGIIDLP